MGLFSKAPPPPPTGWYVPYKDIKPLMNTRNQPAVFIWQAFPFLKNFYTNYELTYDQVPNLQDVLRRNWQAPLIAIAIYVVVIFGGRRVMRDRPAFDLKNALAAWNLFLAVFSFYGVLRTWPYLAYWMANLTFKEINCTHPSYTHGERDIGFAVMLFIFSKFFELIDTLFIVLRKKPLIFLHWYHHVTVLLFCYFSSANHHAGLFFVAMNYGVHSIMYFYFFLMAIKKIPKWVNPVWITVAQISQMFVGVFVTLSTLYYKTHGECVGAKLPLLYGSLAMYGSYLYLFVEFAVLRFIIAPRKRAAKLKAAGKKDTMPPPATILLKKMSSIVTGGEPPVEDDQGVPLAKPYFTNQTSAYSFHVAMEGTKEEEADVDAPAAAKKEGKKKR